MKLIFCLDNNNGMMFAGRRQSGDRLLREKILSMTAGSKLYMSRYSAAQFAQPDGTMPDGVTADDDYMSLAGKNDYCFVEDGAYDANAADEIVICRWNRDYPADRYFGTDLESSGFEKISSEDIAGSSHEKITIERYERRRS